MAWQRQQRGGIGAAQRRGMAGSMWRREKPA